MIQVLDTGRNHCIKIYEGKYEISVAVEEHRSEIRVYRVENDKDVTHLFSGGDSDIYYTNDELIRVINLAKEATI